MLVLDELMMDKNISVAEEQRGRFVGKMRSGRLLRVAARQDNRVRDGCVSLFVSGPVFEDPQRNSINLCPN